MLRNIVVICTGNICRSPIAEGLFRQRNQGSDLNVASAGTHALVGRPADPYSVEVMVEHNCDLILNHRAQQANPHLLNNVDLILALDGGHLEWVLSVAPHLRGRVFKLGRWHGNKDIEDPYMKPKEAFLSAYFEISKAVDEWSSKLKMF